MLELSDFSDGEGTELAWREVEFQRAELNPFDFFDQKTDRLEHAADLAVAAFHKRDFVPRVWRVLVETDLGRRGFDPAVVVESDVNSVAQTFDG